MLVTTQLHFTDTKHNERIHSIAMDRSNDGYDDVKTKLMPAANSLSPGQWLTESCVPGRWETEHVRAIRPWGPVTEETESARAIAESYGLPTYQRLLRYPIAGPLNSDGEEPFLECWTHTNPFRPVVDPASVQAIVYAEPRSSKSDYKMPDSKQYREPADIRKESKPAGVSRPVIKSADVNKVYNAAYVSKEKTATPADVLEVVLGYIQHKFRVGANEKTLRQRGLEDAVTTFYFKLQRILEEGRFASKPGKTFSGYVKTCWKRHYLDVCKALKASDKRFRSSTPITTKNFDMNGNATSVIQNLEDSHAVRLSHPGMTPSNPETSVSVSDIMSKQNIDSAIAQCLMDGKSQTEISNLFMVSRHVVSRTKKRIGRLLLPAGKVAR